MVELNTRTLKLSDVCIYTIIARENLTRGTPMLRENKRWVAVQKQHLPEARHKGLQLPIVFADASQCSDLIAWSTVKQVKISDNITEYSIGPLYDVGRMTRPDLIVLSTKQPIPEGDIKPYRLCVTPTVLNRITKKPRRWEQQPGSDDSISSIGLTGAEGKSKLILHLRRERNRKLVNARKEATLLATGRLACEVCGFDFRNVYGEHGNAFCEVHHLEAFAGSIGERITAVEDLAVVCSNCHQMLHHGSQIVSMRQLRSFLSA